MIYIPYNSSFQVYNLMIFSYIPYQTYFYYDSFKKWKKIKNKKNKKWTQENGGVGRCWAHLLSRDTKIITIYRATLIYENELKTSRKDFTQVKR